MKETEYLYGIQPKELDNKGYFKALEYKKIAGMKLYRSLFLKHDKTKEDSDRMFYVERAIKHTGKLLKERDG